MKKRVKKGNCPKCGKIIVRKVPIKRKNPKPTQCNYCGFQIINPYEVFHV